MRVPGEVGLGVGRFGFLVSADSDFLVSVDLDFLVSVDWDFFGIARFGDYSCMCVCVCACACACVCD
jgi:hypothetical protein